MNELDKWAAEQCGVRLCPTNKCYFTKVKSNPSGEAYWAHTWTLSDPRCMQVFREKFRFDTETFGGDLWQCYSDKLDDFFEGKTIQEAELACAKAIMEKVK